MGLDKTRTLENTPRLQFYKKGIFFNYNIKYEHYYNVHTKSFNEYEDFNFLKIQLAPYWFTTDDCYYDGHINKGFTILGVSFGWGYSYAWKNLA